jgi:hypothetical protein
MGRSAVRLWAVVIPLVVVLGGACTLPDYGVSYSLENPCSVPLTFQLWRTFPYLGQGEPDETQPPDYVEVLQPHQSSGYGVLPGGIAVWRIPEVAYRYRFEEPQEGDAEVTISPDPATCPS